jgi:6-phosphogluconolactonase
VTKETALPDEPRREELIIGTYTEHLPHVDGKAEGILSCSFDGTTLAAPRLLAQTRNPSFLVLSRDGRRLYAVNETVTFEDRPGGGVSAFSRDTGTGELSLLNTKPSGGVEPAHIELDPSERFVLVANYRSGSVAVFEVEEDGSLGNMTGHIQHEGGSLHPVRQTGPHAHMVAFDPRTGDVLVPDLGIDAVILYALTERGGLVEHRGRRIELTPGAGPRHLAFHQRGDYLFVANELDNTLVSFRREAEKFVPVSTTSTLPGGFDGHSQAAAIRVSPSGDWVLVSNRGVASDSVAVVRFDVKDGTLELASLQSTHGREPRELVFAAGGSRVIVANQDDDSIIVFGFDDKTGAHEQLSINPVPTPVCLRVVQK